jgi:hypothetical protein
MVRNPPDTTPPCSVPLAEILVERRQAVVRLSENHYLVQWQPRSSMWCVINMTELDEHAETCAPFRFRKSCEHLDFVSQLCSQERQAISRSPK